MMSFQLRLQGNHTHLKVGIVVSSSVSIHDEKMIVSIGKLLRDDWAEMYMEFLQLQEQKKVVHLLSIISLSCSSKCVFSST